MPLITRNKMSSHQGDAPLCKSSGEKSQQFHFSPTVALLLCMGVSLGLALLHTQQQLAQRNFEMQLLVQHQGLEENEITSEVPSIRAAPRAELSLQQPVPASQALWEELQKQQQQQPQQRGDEHSSSSSNQGGSKGERARKVVPDIFVGVFTAFDTPAALAAEAWAVNEESGAAPGQIHKDNFAHQTANTAGSIKAPDSTISLHRPKDTKLRYAYRLRRQAMRMTWFPMGYDRLEALEQSLGVMMRFVVGGCGKCGNQSELMEASLDKENKQYGDILRLPNHEESYHSLASKTRAFFVSVTNIFLSADGLAHFQPRQLKKEEKQAYSEESHDLDLIARMPRWVVKVDDDVYMQLQRLVAASLQWSRMGAEYVGCMKHGTVFTEPRARWYEAQHDLLGNTYYMHAYGSVYGISGHVVAEVIFRNSENLRLLANEDTTVGLWMVSHNVKHFEDMRLCVPGCHPAAVAVLRSECAGLCNPVHDLVSAHNSSACRRTWDWGSKGAQNRQLPKEGRVIRVEDLRGKGRPASTRAPSAPESQAAITDVQSTGRPVEGKHADALDGGTGGNPGNGAGDMKAAGGEEPAQRVRTRSWDEMVQMSLGELPYLPSYPEHTAFERMWV